MADGVHSVAVNTSGFGADILYVYMFLYGYDIYTTVSLNQFSVNIILKTLENAVILHVFLNKLYLCFIIIKKIS
jgi:hypothetical protein